MSDIVKALEDLLATLPVECRDCKRGATFAGQHCALCERRAAAQAELDAIPVLEWHGDTAHLGAWTLTVRDDGSWTIYAYTLLAGRGGNDSQEGSRLMVEDILRAFGVSFRTVRK